MIIFFLSGKDLVAQKVTLSYLSSGGFSISFLICFTDTSLLDINFCFCIISKNSFTYIKPIDWMKLQYVMRNEHVCLRFYCARWFWWIRGCQQHTVREREREKKKKNKPIATVWYARTTYRQTHVKKRYTHESER